MMAAMDEDDWEYYLEQELEEEQEFLDELLEERNASWASAAGRRRWAWLMRQKAIQKGARPYVPRWGLGPNAVVWDGEVYQIIEVKCDAGRGHDCVSWGQG
jgi:hypothetical protein